MNVHGLWNGMGKTDTPERIAQSQKIRNFMDTLNTPKILCGDFNLRPETESLKMLKKDMKNLVQIYNFPSTRSNHYPKRNEEPFADYVLTCPKITVTHFTVLEDQVSDHMPLLLEF
jgi:endonuclease/exonuclease/phosphatase family metal-dependent hydrolase